ncbi:MAG TPA: hypothetical protein VGF09_06495, partial [Solirubrobacterales bacterium]
MRDPVLNQAIKQLAAEAATRFATLVASGDQIPFDVDEQAGPDSPFHSYRPLTSEYVLGREGELRSLPGFEAARDAVDVADVAAAYLEGQGAAVPVDSGERATQMLVAFFAALWDGCTEFSLDRARLDGALALLDAELCDVDETDFLIAPIVGLQMPLPRLHLPHGMQAVRADAIEAPVEAMRSEGMGRRAWEPQFLAIAEQGDGAESAAEAMRQLHELITVMRLFKEGGVGLGPHAFARTGEGAWKRVATGAGAVRPGGYLLTRSEAESLAEFASSLEVRPDPDGALAWAVERFEMGRSRESAMRGLSDHLLAMRSVLGGDGPVGASLPKRAAALIEDDPVARGVCHERIEAAIALERSLMAGGPPAGTPELAAWVEEGVREILRQAALGEISTDLGAAADDSLIALGLAEGDAEITVSASSPRPKELPDMPDHPGMPGREAEDMPGIDVTQPSSGSGRNLSFPGPDDGPADQAEGPADNIWDSEEDDMRYHQDTRIMEPIPEDDEIRITATNWLEEVEADEDATLEWRSASRSEGREPIDTPTVRHLFPVPEDA